MIIDVRGTTRFTNDRNFGAQFDTHFQVNCGAATFEKLKANMERNAGFGQTGLKTQ